MGRYQANVRRWKDEGRMLFRSRKEREEQRKKEGVESKANWFKIGGVTATLTVPATEDSELKEKTDKVINEAKGPRYTKTKILE